MDKQAIVRLIVRLSSKEPTLYIIEAIQLLNTALLLYDEDRTLSTLLYSRALKLLTATNKEEQ